jgi:class 3 adenylate cyclase
VLNRSIRLFPAAASSALLLALVLLTSGPLSGLAAQADIQADTQPGRAPRAEAGVLDFRDWPLRQVGALKLNGTWRFVPGRYLTPEELQAERFEAYPIEVPQKWSASEVPGFSGELYGRGTYLLEVRFAPDAPEFLGLKVGLVGTAHRLYADGRLLHKAGSPGTGRSSTVPSWKPYVTEVQRSGDRLRLMVHVANYHDISGGLHYPIYLGTPGQVYQIRYDKLLFDLFLFGSLLIMAFYHIGLYLYRRKDRSPLYFAVLSLLLALRIVILEEMFILEIWPDISWHVLTAGSFLSFSLAVFAFFRFIASVFPDYVPRWTIRTVDTVSLAYSLFIIAAPFHIYLHGLLPFQLFTLVTGLFVIYVLVRAARAGKTGAQLFIMGFLLFFLTIIHDIVKTQVVLPTMFLVPFGLLLFVFFQSLVMTKKFAFAFASSEEMSEHLMRLNTSMQRFVPREFLAFLQKESVMDVRLGDHASRRMSVLFVDIRNFTSLSERMKPEENFRFINSFLERMGPIVRTHRGFVDKYLGDGIMALFPETPGDALGAAVAMRRELVRYNRDRAKADYQAIDFGVGIHTGELMLGTVGENKRMDGTVISDAVNLASRIETLTKVHGIGIAVSEATYREAGGESCSYAFRYIGKERVKGKEREVAIYEVTGEKEGEAAGGGESALSPPAGQ